LRFDDMIATVLRQGEEHPSAVAAKWRQLVDLVAQRRGEAGGAEEALTWLRDRRNLVPAPARAEVARTLAGRRVSPDALGFFAEDQAAVAAPLFAGALLSGEEWIDLLPRLGPTARGLLRHRRDLPPEAEHALASFGATDFSLSGDVAAPVAAAAPGIEKSETQIRELVARIENFRRRREADAAAAERPDRVEEFQWETGPDGIILWVEGAPRGPLVGESIASIAERGAFGVDGQAAGAFEKRAPFRDARFSVPGSGPAAGDWRISGVPFFDSAQGTFLGYRGSARRPRLDEVAHGGAGAEGGGGGGLFGTDLPADSLRQLIHELRTPLNAIIGFAEMIDGEYMGPAALAYRARAADIMDQARRLLSAVDDLDTAARLETKRLEIEESSVDAVALLCRLHDAYERVAQQRGSRIAVEIERDLPPAKVELEAAERMFARMLAATIGLAGEGEVIAATMALGQNNGAKMLCLSIDRPRAIEGLDERALLDPGYSPDGDWPGAPALGLGFALRLVRNLAEAVGGALEIGEARFFLYLPAAEPAELSSGQGG
jgi:hypothetical protein